MAELQSRKLAKSGQKQSRMLKVFESSRESSVPLSQYLWKIVAALNKRADPCLFATDGSDLSLHREQKSMDKLDVVAAATAVSSSAAAIETSQLEDNSAMARGLRCLLLALVYIDRAWELVRWYISSWMFWPIIFVHIEPTYVGRYNWHDSPVSMVFSMFMMYKLSMRCVRLMLTAIYLAVKFSDDSLPQPHHWFARIGGLSTNKLSKLEAAFCKLVGFEFYVSETEVSVLFGFEAPVRSELMPLP